MMAESQTLTLKSQPRMRLSSSAIAYIEMPDEKTVMPAKVMALRARVFSSNRILRYSGTERAFDP